MSIIEKQIVLNKVTAEQAQKARKEFQTEVAELIKKMQQENMKHAKGTSPKQLEAGKKEYSLIVAAATKEFPREAVTNKDSRRTYFVKKVARQRAARVREQEASAGLNA